VGHMDFGEGKRPAVHQERMPGRVSGYNVRVLFLQEIPRLNLSLSPGCRIDSFVSPCPFLKRQNNGNGDLNGHGSKFGGNGIFWVSGGARDFVLFPV
jgi:hypothetical protein